MTGQVTLNVPLQWFDESWNTTDQPATREEAMRYASALADILIAEAGEEINVTYDVTDYGDRPTAWNYDLSEMHERAWALLCRGEE